MFLGGLIGAGGAKFVKHAEWKHTVCAALDRDIYGYPAVATGEARYTATGGRHFVTLEDGSDVLGNVTPAIARGGAVATPDNGVSSAQSSRTGEAEAPRAEGARQETETKQGPTMPPDEGQAADRAAGRLNSKTSQVEMIAQEQQAIDEALVKRLSQMWPPILPVPAKFITEDGGPWVARRLATYDGVQKRQ